MEAGIRAPSLRRSDAARSIGASARTRFLHARPIIAGLSSRRISEWLVPGLRANENGITSFYGDGGTGKSLASMSSLHCQCRRLGVHWLGLECEPWTSAVYLSAEDDKDRVAHVALPATFSAVTGIDLRRAFGMPQDEVSLAGDDSLLARCSSSTSTRTGLCETDAIV